VTECDWALGFLIFSLLCAKNHSAMGTQVSSSRICGFFQHRVVIGHLGAPKYSAIDVIMRLGYW